jgi:hypothetical protein
MRTNLLLLLVSTLLVLAGLEVAIRQGLVPLPEYLNTSPWWKEAWFRTRRGIIPQEFVKLDPDLGWVPAPDLDGLILEGAPIGTNSRSLRGKREIPLERSDAPRIAVTGDSFVFGQCVADEDTFPAQLARLLPGSEVLNLGVMGYGHDQALLRLRRDGLPFQPDVAVLGFHRDDVHRNRLSFREYGKPRFEFDGEELELTNVPIPSPEEYDRALWPPRVANYAWMLHDRLRWDAVQGQAYRLTREILRQFAQDVREAGAAPVLVYLPREEDLRKKEPYPVSQMARSCRDDDVLCLSPIARIRDAVGERPDERHFECHYSPEVYGLVAAEVAEGLRAAFPDLFAQTPAAAQER